MHKVVLCIFYARYSKKRARADGVFSGMFGIHSTQYIQKFCHKTFIMRILYGSVESSDPTEEDHEASSSSSSRVNTISSDSDPKAVAYRVGMNSLYREGQSQTFDEESPVVSGKSAPIKSDEQGRTKLKVLSVAGLCFSLVLLLFVSGVLDRQSSEGMTSTEKLIEVRPSSTSMPTPTLSSSSSSRAACPLTSTSSSSCTRDTTSFIVEADPTGQWPEGFSWTLLKDSDGDPARKSVIYSTNGEDAARTYAHVDCRSFDTELCLSGKHLVYADSARLNLKESSKSSVKVCNNILVSGEALHFDADEDQCNQGQQRTLRTPDTSSTTSSSEHWLGVDGHHELKCTLFGLSCKPANEPTYEPSAEPTMMPTYPDSHWNQTTVVHCHFFGLWCV